MEGVVQNLHFQVFIYILNLFFQDDHANSYDLFFSSTYVCRRATRGGAFGAKMKFYILIIFKKSYWNFSLSCPLIITLQDLT